MAGIKTRLAHKPLGTMRWKRLRAEILDRDDRICYYCGGEATSVDHVISRALGGDMWDRNNLISACKSCNSRKGKKAFFGGKVSTPPALLPFSLSNQVSFRPDSPFEQPE